MLRLASRWEHQPITLDQLGKVPAITQGQKSTSCYEEMGDYAGAFEIYQQIADDLERRGFEAEVNWPRSLAHKCRDKISV